MTVGQICSFQQRLLVGFRRQHGPEALQREAVLDLLHGDAQLAAEHHLRAPLLAAAAATATVRQVRGKRVLALVVGVVYLIDVIHRVEFYYFLRLGKFILWKRYYQNDVALLLTHFSLILHAEDGGGGVELVEGGDLPLDLLQLLQRVDPEAQDVASAQLGTLDHKSHSEFRLSQPDLVHGHGKREGKRWTLHKLKCMY